MGRGPAHTLPGYLCPSPITLPAPWASTTPSTHFSPAGAKCRGQGQEQFGFSCSENIPSKNDDAEAAMAALREPGGVFPRTYLLPYKPMGKKGVWPPPLPRASHCSPMVGPTAPDATPQRTNPHSRSRDGQDTGEWTWQHRGRTPSCPSRWGREPLLLGHQPQGIHDWHSPMKPHNPPTLRTTPSNTEAMPAMVQRRPDHSSQTHRPEASGEP